MKRRIFLLMLLLFPSDVFAQFYTFGNDPSRVKWSQIVTDDYRFIFPREIDSLAREYIYTAQKMRSLVYEGLDISGGRIPVVLHPYTTLSNGNASIAPRLINFITTPDAYDTPPEPWMRSLVVHEQRHIAQFEHFTKGFWKWLHPVFGDQIAGLGIGLFARYSTLEGDAVVCETETGYAGRGRSASFLMYLRSLAIDDKWLNFNQSVLGSYRYKEVGAYPFGYALVTAARLDKDNYRYMGDFYNAAGPQLYLLRYPFVPKSERKYTPWPMYMDKLKQTYGRIWKDDLALRSAPSPFDTVSPRKARLYCDYTSPVIYDGSVIAVKKGLEYSSRLVEIDSLSKERFLIDFPSYHSRLTLSEDGRIYWSETRLKGFNGLEDFSTISYYDLNSHKRGVFPGKTRYFNPSPSCDGTKVYAAEYPVSGSSYLVGLSALDGSLEMRVEAPSKGQILECAASDDGIHCSVIVEDGIGIWLYGEDSLWHQIIAPHHSSMTDLSCSGEDLHFTSDLDGVLNIYDYNLADRILYRLTDSRYGASSPCFTDDGTLCYCEYGRDGYTLAKAHIDSLPWHIVSFEKPYRNPVVEMLSLQMKRDSDVTPIGDSSYFDSAFHPSRKYNKFLNAIHIHSWAPVYYNVDRIMSAEFSGSYYSLVSPGATVYSQNELGTLVTMAGYSYHGGFHSAHGKISGKVLDCDVELSLDWNDRMQSVSSVDEEGKVVTAEGERRFLNTSLVVDYSANFYGGGWTRVFVPQLQWRWSNDLYGTDADMVHSSHLVFGFNYYQKVALAHSRIYPLWGFGVRCLAGVPVSSSDVFAGMLFCSAYCYLPGFTSLQGVKLSGVWQKRLGHPGQFIGSNVASLPRGYTSGYPSADYIKGSLDYAIPIWLGDISIPYVLYLKRLRLIPFGDLALNRAFSGESRTLYSYGADALVDFNFLGYEVNISAGLRYARTAPDGEGKCNNFTSMLFNVSL